MSTLFMPYALLLRSGVVTCETEELFSDQLLHLCPSHDASTVVVVLSRLERGRSRVPSLLCLSDWPALGLACSQTKRCALPNRTSTALLSQFILQRYSHSQDASTL